MGVSPEARPLREGLVSIIVPVRNRPRLLVEAVESALSQTHREIEVLVVDDGSTDDTPEAISALCARDSERLRRFRHETSRGPGPSRELARVAAAGEFLQYLDSDDSLMPDKLELQIAALRADPAASVAYGWTRLRRSDGSSEGRPFKRSGERVETIFPAFLAGRVWNTVTPLYRAEICRKSGPWSDLWLEEDWEYDCRLGALGARLAYVEEWVCEYRLHEAEHLGQGDPLNPARLRQRASAHLLIANHARKAGFGPEVPEVARFARSLFSLARRCGAAGLAVEARSLFLAARERSTPERAKGLDYRLVGTLAGLLGWRIAGRLSMMADRVLRGPSGRVA